MFLKSTKCSNMSCGTFAKAKKMITRQDVRTVLLGYNYITAGMLEAAAVPQYITKLISKAKQKAQCCYSSGSNITSGTSVAIGFTIIMLMKRLVTN